MNKSGNILFQEVVDTDVLERIIYDIIIAYPILTSFRAQWAFIVAWDTECWHILIILATSKQEVMQLVMCRVLF